MSRHDRQAPIIGSQSERIIAITATFTAEPVEEFLSFWSQELEIPFQVKFAPNNQVFQQLLDPASSIHKNKNGMNVILVRFEDWIRRDESSSAESSVIEKIKENVQDLVVATRAASERSATPHLVCVCPAPPATLVDMERMAFYERIEDLMAFELSSVDNVYLVNSSELATVYPVPMYYDSYADELGHMPYTSTFFAALGTLIARKYYATQSAPYKVIVLDCDQTLWKGICGEDGPLGIEIDPPRKRLQEFMVEQLHAGMLVCLCSKNNEQDVLEVFEHHPEMPLQREHIVSWRITWRPKSENIRSLAHELGLGLDSFVFVDDSPIECAEVIANCPQVLTLQLPSEAESVPRFLEHVWAFDHLKTTEEDKKRTTLYQHNVKRERFREESLTLGDFLAGLELEINLLEATPQHFARVAQLTQRTNQFNLTTIRRSETEIQELCQLGRLECLVAKVSDRFGDYGLVGAILFGADDEAIQVDTFLLSCRALGRGVEHRMLARLGEIANARGLGYVVVAYVPTRRSQPALDFLEEVASEYRHQLAGRSLYTLPAEYAVTIAYAPGSEEPKGPEESANDRASLPPPAIQMTSTRSKSERLSHIATNLSSAGQILEAVRSQHRKRRPSLPAEYVAPGSRLEWAIAGIWQSVLGIDKAGIQDNFFEIGGTSLKGVQLIAQMKRELDVDVSIVDLFASPTISSMARKLGGDRRESMIDRGWQASHKRGERRRAKRRSR